MMKRIITFGCLLTMLACGQTEIGSQLAVENSELAVLKRSCSTPNKRVLSYMRMRVTRGINLDFINSSVCRNPIFNSGSKSFALNDDNNQENPSTQIPFATSESGVDGSFVYEEPTPEQIAAWDAERKEKFDQLKSSVTSEFGGLVTPNDEIKNIPAGKKVVYLNFHPGGDPMLLAEWRTMMRAIEAEGSYPINLSGLSGNQLDAKLAEIKTVRPDLTENMRVASTGHGYEAGKNEFAPPPGSTPEDTPEETEVAHKSFTGIDGESRKEVDTVDDLAMPFINASGTTCNLYLGQCEVGAAQEKLKERLKDSGKSGNVLFSSRASESSIVLSEANGGEEGRRATLENPDDKWMEGSLTYMLKSQSDPATKKRLDTDEDGIVSFTEISEGIEKDGGITNKKNWQPAETELIGTDFEGNGDGPAVERLAFGYEGQKIEVLKFGDSPGKGSIFSFTEDSGANKAPYGSLDTAREGAERGNTDSNIPTTVVIKENPTAAWQNVESPPSESEENTEASGGN